MYTEYLYYIYIYNIRYSMYSYINCINLHRSGIYIPGIQDTIYGIIQ